jgi:alpha-1,2-mannosyltransferase
MAWIDYEYYQKWMIVPLNIVLYNVLNTDPSRGPNLYGTEPWHFYLQNGLLNFNIAFLLALLSALTVFLGKNQVMTKEHGWRLSFFYLWLFVFMKQPHKEERFIYVVYPLICWNASFSVVTLMSFVSKKSKSVTPSVSVFLGKFKLRC